MALASLRLLPAAEDAHSDEVDSDEPGESTQTADQLAGEVEQLYQRGLRRLRRGGYQPAAQHFTAALNLDPDHPLLYAQRGEAFRLLCEYERAIADYDVALRLDPSTPTVLVSRAVAYQFNGEPEQAIIDCGAALELDPAHAAAYRTRAAAYAEQEDYDRALADLTEAVKLTPQDDETR